MVVVMSNTQPVSIADLTTVHVVDVEAITSLIETLPPSTRDSPLKLSQAPHDPEKQTDHSDRESRQWLIASPYTSQRHQLNLHTLDPQNQIFAIALQLLSPSTSNYATTRYVSAFEWTPVLSAMRSLVSLSGTPWPEQTFYVVEFRSLLKPDIDRALLYQLDAESHAEATASGGLLKYWYGVPDAERRNLATCFWRSKEDAMAGGTGPWHKQARAVIARMYERISVSALTMVVEEGVKGVRFEGVGGGRDHVFTAPSV